jgi:hypothetical protein
MFVSDAILSPHNGALTYNRAGSRWIVCTTGCDMLPIVDEMRVLEGSEEVWWVRLRCSMMQTESSHAAGCGIRETARVRPRLP